MRIVLYQPEIPANTGNIGRMCVGAGVELHLVRPMRFLITDKYLKRAGLDYWPKLKVFYHESLDEVLAEFPDSTAYYCTTKTKRRYTDVFFKTGDLLIFGPESRGLPEPLLHAHAETNITIPMSSDIRSHNLANSVAIILFEALRQTGGLL